jgi:hypothetical protein
MVHATLARWHEIVSRADPSALQDVLAEEVVFHSPVVHTPQRGRDLTTMYLVAAMQVLGGDTFRYVREIVSDRDIVLEFETEVDGLHINGVDMMHLDEAGRIDDFKVMVRPLKAINAVHQAMRRMLGQAAQGATVANAPEQGN